VLRRVVTNANEAGGHGGVAGGRVLVGKDADEAAWKSMEQTLVARLAKRLRLPADAEFRRIFVHPTLGPRGSSNPL
jgi:hypothetical protein